MPITASMLYDLATCEHRPTMDRYADPALRDPASPFVEMLWRNGRAHEDEVMAGDGVDALNLRLEPGDERATATIAAMRDGVPLIYGGRLEVDDLRGEPDLLRLVSPRRYIAGDIKSGSAEEGPADARKPKATYAVQLALYVDCLERLGFGIGRRAFIWDVNGEEVEYNLDAAKGVRTPSSFWDDYLEFAELARAVVAGTARTEPAATASCKLCHWRTTCSRTLEERGDLTLIADLSRRMREPLRAHVGSITELAATQPERLIGSKGKSLVPGVSADSLRKFHARAVLLTTHGEPYLTQPVTFPPHRTELFFDLETLPADNHCYLHGFVERRNGDPTTERYHAFFTDAHRDEAEHRAFAEAWVYVQSRRPCTLVIYSKAERTWWRILQHRFPDVCTPEEVEELFSSENCVDLYRVARASAEWPTYDRSLKTLAKYVGFSWRDEDPSGASSIEWYNRLRAGDIRMKQRLLDYNEDDCRATRALLDAIRRMGRAA
jgi:uncharacterized protein